MKVNVPVASSMKKYKHDLSHDVSTTSDIGFMQPLMVREFPAKSTINFRAAQIARLQPIAVPTFGSLSLKTYNVFVPIESIYHPYASLRTGQTYRGADSRYIPKKVINGNLRLLNAVCKLFSTVTVWNAGQDATVTGNTDVEIQYGAAELVTDDTQISWNDVITLWMSQYTLDSGESYTLANLYDVFQVTEQDVDFPRKDVVSEGAAEFGDNLGYDWIDVIEGQSTTYYVCGKYTQAGKNLRKILYGCGYKLNDSLIERSYLPLFAYYKAWFDLFAPQRDTTWKDTQIAGIQEWMEQTGNFSFFDLLENEDSRLYWFFHDLCECYYTQSPDFVSAHITGQRIGATPDYSYLYLGSGQYEPAEEVPDGVVSTQGRQTAIFPGLTSSANILKNLLTADGINLLQRVAKRNNAHTPLGGRIREILKMITGADYIEEDESYWIGSQKMDIVINPIFNTAETDKGFLGQFRGEGSAGMPGQQFKYETKVDGFWVCFAAVVPDAKFAQGVDMTLKHVTKEDFWDPLYDSQTLLPTLQDYIFGENQLRVNQEEELYDLSFGNVPAQIEYCIAQNVVNGDMSLMSKRATFLPYTLDKLLPYTQFYTDGTKVYIKQLDSSLLVNGIIWRYVGLNKWIGNYDRIFVNEGEEGKTAYISQSDSQLFDVDGIDDNIILHNALFCEYYHMKLPVRDSYNTGAFDQDSMTVEMA